MNMEGIGNRACRIRADRKMREIFGDFNGTVDITKFYGISAIGTNMRIYTQDVNGNIVCKTVGVSIS